MHINAEVEVPVSFALMAPEGGWGDPGCGWGVRTCPSHCDFRMRHKRTRCLFPDDGRQ
jgi:hypothetical protein